jgi:hypothetical protein
VEHSQERRREDLGGELGARPLAVLLAMLVEDGASGTVTLSDGERSGTIVLHEGLIARVWTSEPVAYLGGVLYEMGAIDATTLNETLLVVATQRRLHGEVLLERRAITESQLADGLVEQTCRKLHHLFTFPDNATWAFDEVIQPARDDGRPLVDPWRGIWRAVREYPPATHLARTLARATGALHLRDTSLLIRLDLAPEERTFAEHLAMTPTTLEELTRKGTLARAHVERLVYLFALARALERVQIEPTAPAALGKEGILVRAHKIVDEDPYTVLGLPQGATAEAIRAAYFRLAKLWHPDRLPTELADMRPHAELVFTRICEAHRALTSSATQPNMAAVVAPAIRDVLDAPPPAPSLRDVDRALEHDDFARAADIAERLASDGKEGPGARAVLAYCEARAGADHERVAAAVVALDKVIAGDPECARAFFYRGLLHKRAGKMDAAQRDLRKATRIDPRHVEAAREVRLFEMRARTGSQAGMPAVESASGLRRLFGRALGR